MVNTRSQARSSIPVFMSKASRNDRVSDTESECSIPDLLTRDQIDELDNENLIHSEQHSDQMTIDQRFSSMNRQINELTGLVLALTEKLSSNHGEGNDQNTVIDKTSARSDTKDSEKNFFAGKLKKQNFVKGIFEPFSQKFFSQNFFRIFGKPHCAENKMWLCSQNAVSAKTQEGTLGFMKFRKKSHSAENKTQRTLNCSTSIQILSFSTTFEPTHSFFSDLKKSGLTIW